MPAFHAHAAARPGPVVPPMRGRPALPLPQNTPIYDGLYAEFQQAFRTLPGDRSGEDNLRFTGFAPWTDGSEVGLAPGGAGSSFHRHEYASRRMPAAPGRHRFALPPGRS